MIQWQLDGTLYLNNAADEELITIPTIIIDIPTIVYVTYKSVRLSGDQYDFSLAVPQVSQLKEDSSINHHVKEKNVQLI